MTTYTGISLAGTSDPCCFAPVFHPQVASAGAAVDASVVSSHIFPEAAGSTVVVVDGVFRPELSKLDNIPKSVYVGSLSAAPAEAAQLLVR